MAQLFYTLGFALLLFTNAMTTDNVVLGVVNAAGAIYLGVAAWIITRNLD